MTDGHTRRLESEHLRPDFSQIDAWGLTHQGKVRTENQDPFFLGSLAPGVALDASSIGGGEAAPVVTRMTRDWGTVLLLCSDGLTKHVPDERIKERLAAMTSCRQVAEQLLQDALDGGGTDNITVVVGRTLPAPGTD